MAYVIGIFLISIDFSLSFLRISLRVHEYGLWRDRSFSFYDENYQHVGNKLIDLTGAIMGLSNFLSTYILSPTP
jgi:hypothetical protein